MNKVSFNQVVIYHDETKNVPGRNFKGHILFFVPARLVVASNTPLFGTDVIDYSPQHMLFEKIENARREFSCDGKLHYSKVSGKRWSKYDYAYRDAVELTVDAMRHKFQKRYPNPLNCKAAAMFYPKGADWSIYGGDARKEQKLRHDETILRMLLKGASHYLYSDSDLIEVVSIVTDGQPNHRPLDDDRVVWKITNDDLYGRTPLRDYVSFGSDASIIHLPSNHKEYDPSTEEYMRATLLQIADLLLGSIMRSCYVGITNCKRTPRIEEECNKKDVIAQPVKRMLDKKKRGAGFRNSGHYKSFTISQVGFSEEGVHFREIQPKELSIQDSDSLQLQFEIQ